MLESRSPPHPPGASWFKNQAFSFLRLVPSTGCSSQSWPAAVAWFPEWRACSSQFCPCFSSLRLLSSVIQG